MPEETKNEGKIVLETRIHCDDCRYKVYKAIIGYPGVEDLNIDMKDNKVTLKAPKVDAKKLFESVKKKSGGKVTKLVYPDPKDIKKEEAKKEEKKLVTVVLKASMDCSSCTKKVEKAAWKIKDVQSVKAEGETLTVKGWGLDPKKVCEAIIKKSGRYAEVVPPKKDGEKKDGNAPQGITQNVYTPQAITQNVYTPQAITQYVYAPQYFSEENPNACTIM